MFSKLNIVLVVVMQLMLFSKVCYAQRNSDTNTTERICSGQYFIDSANVHTLESIGKLPADSLKPFSCTSNFVQMNQPIWLKLKLDCSNQKNHIIILTPGIDSIVLYVQDKVYYQGSKIKAESKYLSTFYPIFELPDTSVGKVTCWVRLKNAEGVINLNIQKGGLKQIFNKSESHQLIILGFITLLFVVLVANGLLYLFTKLDVVLSFSLFNLSTLLFVLLTSNAMVALPFDIDYYLSPYPTLFLGFLIISGIFMSITILEIKKHSPKVYKLLIGLVVIVSALIILSWLGYDDVAGLILNPLGGLIIPIYIYESFVAYKRGLHYALYYLIGWLVYYIVMIAIILMIYQVFTFGDYGNFLLPLVSMIDFFLIMTTVVSIFNFYRKEKERIEKENLDQIQSQNILLEQRVLERTLDLDESNHEIAAQNEELQSQKEEIVQLNNTLEKKVEERTAQLQNRTNELENFSYVISHNLRSPVSTIKSLIGLYNFSKVDDPANQEVLEFLKRSVVSLDRVIGDLNYIVSTKKAVSDDLGILSLEDIFKLSCVLLENEIKASNTQFEVNFSEAEHVTSVSAYLHNIFYNLISNSIKYSKEGVTPQINIRSYKNEKKTIIEFSDNGIGMNLKVIDAEKVFNLFQRFNYEKEGSGLGLYLIKYQVDLLNGSIEIKSAPGNGTMFIISLP